MREILAPQKNLNLRCITPQDPVTAKETKMSRNEESSDRWGVQTHHKRKEVTTVKGTTTSHSETKTTIPNQTMTLEPQDWVVPSPEEDFYQDQMERARSAKNQKRSFERRVRATELEAFSKETNLGKWDPKKTSWPVFQMDLTMECAQQQYHGEPNKIAVLQHCVVESVRNFLRKKEVQHIREMNTRSKQNDERPKEPGALISQLDFSVYASWLSQKYPAENFLAVKTQELRELSRKTGETIEEGLTRVDKLINLIDSTIDHADDWGYASPNSINESTVNQNLSKYRLREHEKVKSVMALLTPKECTTMIKELKGDETYLSACTYLENDIYHVERGLNNGSSAPTRQTPSDKSRRTNLGDEEQEARKSDFLRQRLETQKDELH
jgi:hypothetical protein